jgi:flagellar biosynthesis/type III secretory pathway protein FliH
MHQQQLEAQKRKQKQEADIASGRTYEAGHREGYADGWDTGWDAGQQAGIQLMIDKMEAGDFDYIYYPEDEAEEAEING